MDTPDYYQKCSASIEVTFNSFDLVGFYSFYAGNFLKYMLRYKHKGSPLADLIKARNYLLKLQEEHESEVLREPLFKSDFEFSIMIQAYRDKYSWFKSCVDEDGVLFNKANYEDMLNYINHLIERYSV